MRLHGMQPQMRCRLKVLFQIRFDRGGDGFFVLAFDVDGDRIALLDAHAHEGHQLQRVHGLLTLVAPVNSLIFFTRFPAGRAWMPTGSVIVYSNDFIAFLLIY